MVQSRTTLIWRETMTAAVETMAYAGDVPWHGLGVPVKDNMTPTAMLKAAGLDWSVSKHQIFRKVDEKLEAIPGEMELRRDSDNRFFDIVGSDWKEVQNSDVFDFFTKFAKEAKLSMETAGALWDGQIIWSLARINKDFSVGGKGDGADKIQSYVLLASPHQRNRALLALHTAVRVVCWNTLTAALGGGWRQAAKRDDVFRMPHSQKFDDEMKKKAAEALGIAIAQTEEFKEAAVHLASKKAAPKAVEQYFAEVLRFDPKQADKKKDGEVKEPRMLGYFRTALLTAPGHDLVTARGTWWGALNAVTRVVDHELGRERDTALRTAWFGTRAKLKRDALKLALEKAKK